jgi:hypothetical protein
MKEIRVGTPDVSGEGDERLSGSKQGDTRRRASPSAGGRSSRKDKTNPVGRALRSVYDDTLRESVPDDFLDLLRKLD